MLFERVAVIVVRIAAWGAFLVLSFGIPAMPRGIKPVVTDLALSAVSMSRNHSWVQGSAAAFPDGVVRTTSPGIRTVWWPRSCALPDMDRVIAVIRRGMLQDPAAENRQMTSLSIFDRWRPVRRLRAVFDCRTGRRVGLHPDPVPVEDESGADAASLCTWRKDAVTRILGGQA